jgi:hypothetical protein
MTDQLGDLAAGFADAVAQARHPRPPPHRSDGLDVRLWTATGGVRMASANGLTLHLNDVPKLIAALERAAGKDAA